MQGSMQVFADLLAKIIDQHNRPSLQEVLVNITMLSSAIPGSFLKMPAAQCRGSCRP